MFYTCPPLMRSTNGSKSQQKQNLKTHKVFKELENKVINGGQQIKRIADKSFKHAALIPCYLYETKKG